MGPEHMAQILISKYHSPIKYTVLVGENLDSRARRSKIKNGPGTFVVPRSKKMLKDHNDENMLKVHSKSSQRPILVTK